MDDLNNNMFGEENHSQTPENPTQPTDPYNTPINQQAPQQSPYNTPINQQQPQQNPYNEQNNNPFAQQAAIYEGPKPSSGMATASMVLGIISVVLWLFMWEC